jgi:Ca2+-binding RTX toxin-like protein
MRGGAGNDIYFIDDVGDRVIEDPNQGTDTLLTYIDYGLPANIEIGGVWTTVGTKLIGNALGNTLYGNAGNDWLDGGTGGDEMRGGAGNDIYFVDDVGDRVIEDPNQGTDTLLTYIDYGLPADIEIGGVWTTAGTKLVGNALGNTLYGNSGNDWLDGGTGGDEMRGGAGNDIYFVDDVGDRVIEDPNQGTDTVLTYIDYGLPANIEIGGVWTTAGAKLTGNTLDNTLYGNIGNDWIDGSSGADEMRGGAGNDIYFVDNAGDRVIEDANKGTDTLLTYVDAILPQNIEIGGVWSTTGRALVGNSLDNVLYGNSGNDRLIGGAGADTLYGGGGSDAFVFQDGYGSDLVADFETGLDKVDLAGVASVHSFSQLIQAATQLGPDVRFSFSPTDSLMLGNVQLVTLTANNFTFS